jgi:tRNA threonylcarbamoyladenosine biosynthesis protein TsaB
MSVILGIETATDVCAAAVDVDGTVVCSVSLDRPRRHAERLVPMIGAALRAVGLRADDLQAVAVSAGPGSYTGLRIGVSTAKGICVATSARLLPVPSLEALALAAGAEPGRVVVAAFLARRAEVYAASFLIGPEGFPRTLRGPVAGPPGEALQELGAAPSGPVVVTGDGGRLVSAALRALGTPHVLDPVTRPTASAVVRLGRRIGAGSGPVDVERFEPYYLREFTARPAAGSVFDRLLF